MKAIYCTLFDSNYLSRGYLTIQSLCNVSKECKIYVLAMDQKSYELLRRENMSSVQVINLHEFLDDNLERIKSNRSWTEFCWSCSANLIEYIFRTFDEAYCTYIDADMYFYSDPVILIDEMVNHNKTVQILEHRIKAGKSGEELEKIAGKYCVEFNTFCNCDEARQVLANWIGQINECCSSDANGNTFGDQMYLNEWPEKYSCVHVNKNIGAGIAPWNLNRYKCKKRENGLIYDGEKMMTSPVFYHFHSISQLSEKTYHIDVYRRYWYLDKRVVDYFYLPYLKKLYEKSKEFPAVQFKKMDFTMPKRSFLEELRQRLSWDYIQHFDKNVELRIKNQRSKKRDIICLEE